jgi:acylphosphatase
MPGIVARKYVVEGRVQGVGYRYFTVRVARELGISGWVRNLSDGRVEVLAVGAPRKLSHLEGELRLGPLRAEVRSLQIEEAAIEPATPNGRIEGFHIR